MSDARGRFLGMALPLLVVGVMTVVNVARVLRSAAVREPAQGGRDVLDRPVPQPAGDRGVGVERGHHQASRPFGQRAPGQLG